MHVCFVYCCCCCCFNDIKFNKSLSNFYRFRSHQSKMADTSMATKYDLIQKERVCDDIWLCTTRPSEKCYKPCKVHNPQACDGPLDGAGLPGVDWDDDDVFEAEEETVEECEDEMTDTSFSDNDVWDSDVDAIDDSPTPEQEVANQEMDRWMQVADIFYNQESTSSMPPSYGIIPPPPNGHFQGYFPWNAIYPSAGGFGRFAHPMVPVSFPFPGSVLDPHAYAPTTQQDLINAHNMLNNDPWPLVSRTATNSATNVHQEHQEDSRDWGELIDEQERYQAEMAAAMAAQCVGATEECETSMDPSYVASSPAPRFATHPQNTLYSTDFWRQTQVDQTCS